MIRYVFREPLALKGSDKLDPQKVGETLAKIAEKAGGELTPIAVVDEARNPRHLLHRCFEWDDAKAANAFRLDQARHVIRSIRVEDEDASDGTAPAFVSVAAKGGVSYRTVQEVKSSPDLQAIVLAAAERDLESFERRYRDLTDICAIVRKARESVAAKRQRAERRNESRVSV